MIVVSDLSVRIGRFSLEKISFEIATGEYGVLMGKTGCGKSTLLEVICGLRRLDAGSIELMGRDVTGLKAAERGIGYVPQDRALFTTMSVRENLAFALRIRRWSAPAIAERVDELAELLGIGHLLPRTPDGLSGGESQRVSVGRALACRPGVLCMDEPMSALDDETREEMYALLRSIRECTGVTALHVTHNRPEAERLGDRLLCLRDGVIEEDDDGMDDGMGDRSAPLSEAEIDA